MSSSRWIKNKNENIHKIMEFNGMIFLDCGIFQLFRNELNTKLIESYRDNLINLYNTLLPDVASSLDIPSLLWHRISVKEQRLEWSINNYITMRERVKHCIELVLGICAFSRKSIEIVKQKLSKVDEQIENLGLGGQVPLIKLSVLKPELGKLVIQTAYFMRQAFPNSYIHVYGAGGHRWYMLLRLLGINSADYAGIWQLAARGQIILPGTGPRYISKYIRIKTKDGWRTFVRSDDEMIKKAELKLLQQCECPICKNFDYRVLEYNKKLRLIHNLHVLLSESEIVDQYCKENNHRALVRHVKDRLIRNNSKLRPLAEFTLKLIGERGM
jgi:queuine/archaeosine tRNA-ribosyltransferase